MNSQTDRSKHQSQLAGATLKPWKSHKGYGSSSGQITTPGRNYGRHIDNAIHENMLHLNKTNKTYRCQLDDEGVDMDILTESARCDYAWNNDAGMRQRVEVDLLSIARPARARKNKSELLIYSQVASHHSSCISEQPRASQVYTFAALERVAEQFVADVSDAQSNTSGTDFSYDFGWGDDFGPWSAPCCWSHDDDCCNNMPDMNDSSSSLEPLLTESFSNAARGGHGMPVASFVQLEPLLTEFEYAHKELSNIDPRVFSPTLHSPVTENDDVESLGWDDLAFSESESDVEWVDLNDDEYHDSRYNTASSAYTMKLEAT